METGRAPPNTRVQTKTCMGRWRRGRSFKKLVLLDEGEEEVDK